MRKKAKNNSVKTKTRSGPVPLDLLVSSLEDDNAKVRQEARYQLVKMGHDALPVLLQELHSPHTHTRWEAAKALAEMHDPQAAEGLVSALGDEDRDVRWIAADALISLGHAALQPLFHGLIRNSDSSWVRNGAKRILHSLGESDDAPVIHPVLTALENHAPIFDVPIAAFSALGELHDRETRPPTFEDIMRSGASNKNK